jgi:uncharacterized membrane protein HdeD (DUF308 family)
MLAVVFGGLAMMMPIATAVVLTLVFGVYALVDGLFTLVAAFRRSRRGQWWGGMVLSGLLSLVAGVLVLFWAPEATLGLTTFLWSLFAAWSFCVGMLELVTAARLRRSVGGEWMLGLRGSLSILLSLGIVALMWRNPRATLVGLGWLVGLGSLLSGLTLLMFAFRLQRLGQESGQTQGV